MYTNLVLTKTHSWMTDLTTDIVCALGGIKKVHYKMPQ